MRCIRCGTLGDQTSLVRLHERGHEFPAFQAGAVAGVYGRELEHRDLTQELGKRLAMADFLAGLVDAARRDVSLDFGCGSGLLACAMSRHFGQAFAFDLDLSLARTVAKHLDARVHFKPIEDFGSGSVDLITAWHVVEHLSDAGAFFEQAARVAKPGGCVVCQVPAPLPDYLEDDHLAFLTLESAAWIRKAWGFEGFEVLVDPAMHFLTVVLRR